MPELPEVEGFKRITERTLVGRRIVRARFLDDWMLKDTTPWTAQRRLKGRRVTSVDRRGKMLAIFTKAEKGEHDAAVLALHFGMTGRPVVTAADEPIHTWDRVILDLDDATQFRYRNSRRLGSVRVVTRNEIADIAWRLGPDALEAPVAYLREALATRDAAIKAVLLDQSFLAGVGNIYADEALHAAGINPLRSAKDLGKEEVETLHRALRRILERAVKAQTAGKDAGFPLLRIRARASRQLGASGSPKIGCPRCRRPLRFAKVGGRTTFYCGTCQR
jgi:formamidopyrimidine-DNA glycosylase